MVCAVTQSSKAAGVSCKSIVLQPHCLLFSLNAPNPLQVSLPAGISPHTLYLERYYLSLRSPFKFISLKNSSFVVKTKFISLAKHFYSIQDITSKCGVRLEEGAFDLDATIARKGD